MPLAAGTRLGSYEVLSQIGAGGMGEVYKARDAKLNRNIAIKVLPESLAADPDLLARFEREARAVAALSHPNVMGIHDFGRENGVTFAVMELLEGESLRQKLKGGPLPAKRAVEIAVELATGLGAAHAHGIVHRDVKPENVFVSQDGHVKVLDFGLAKQVAAKGALHSELTTTPATGRSGISASPGMRRESRSSTAAAGSARPRSSASTGLGPASSSCGRRRTSRDRGYPGWPSDPAATSGAPRSRRTRRPSGPSLRAGSRRSTGGGPASSS